MNNACLRDADMRYKTLLASSLFANLLHLTSHRDNERSQGSVLCYSPSAADSTSPFITRSALHKLNSTAFLSLLLTKLCQFMVPFPRIDTSPTDAAAAAAESKLILWLQLPTSRVPDWECAEALFYWPCVAPPRHKVRHQCAVYDLRVLLGL